MSDPFVIALRRLCGGVGRESKARRVEVAERLGVNEQSLYQIVSGVKLSSGRERTVGRDLRAKLDAHYPNWLTPEDHEQAAADRPADDEGELKQALAVVRKHLARAQGKASAEAAEALKLLALTPDSDRAFAAALAALLVQDQQQAQPAPPEEPAAATEDDWRELRKRAMRVAEKSASPAKREQAAQLLRLLDQTIRDGATTEDAARSRHGNNSPAKSAR